MGSAARPDRLPTHGSHAEKPRAGAPSSPDIYFRIPPGLRAAGEEDKGSMARIRKDLEAEWAAAASDAARSEAFIVPLFAGQDGAGARISGAAGADMTVLRRMIEDLESRLLAAERQTLDRLEHLERNLETMETRIAETSEAAADRAQALERSMVRLADRIREMEPR
jgi:hypothetical protein